MISTPNLGNKDDDPNVNGFKAAGTSPPLGAKSRRPASTSTDGEAR